MRAYYLTYDFAPVFDPSGTHPVYITGYLPDRSVVYVLHPDNLDLLKQVAVDGGHVLEDLEDRDPNLKIPVLTSWTFTQN